MDIFYEIYEDIPRQGPGSNVYTRQAYEMLTEAPKEPRILDIGCGGGVQTLELAKISRGCVTGLDNHQPFLDTLAANAQAAGLSDRVKPVNGSMFEMDFAEGSFDIIWAEGSIYIFGFEAGLRQWRRFLQLNGYLAVTEISWLKDNPPAELAKFWQEEYPAIKGINDNLALIRDCGYVDLGHFVLGEDAWLHEYYSPLEKQVAALRQKYPSDAEIAGALDEADAEIALYREFSQWYGYVFYVMHKA